MFTNYADYLLLSEYLKTVPENEKCDLLQTVKHLAFLRLLYRILTILLSFWMISIPPILLALIISPLVCFSVIFHLSTLIAVVIILPALMLFARKPQKEVEQLFIQRPCLREHVEKINKLIKLVPEEKISVIYGKKMFT
jgi:hypothetical protein